MEKDALLPCVRSTESSLLQAICRASHRIYTAPTYFR